MSSESAAHKERLSACVDTRPIHVLGRQKELYGGTLARVRKALQELCSLCSCAACMEDDVRFDAGVRCPVGAHLLCAACFELQGPYWISRSLTKPNDLVAPILALQPLRTSSFITVAMHSVALHGLCVSGLSFWTTCGHWTGSFRRAGEALHDDALADPMDVILPALHAAVSSSETAGIPGTE